MKVLGLQKSSTPLASPLGPLPAPSFPVPAGAWLPRKDLTGNFLELSCWSSSVIQLPTPTSSQSPPTPVSLDGPGLVYHLIDSHSYIIASLWGTVYRSWKEELGMRVKMATRAHRKLRVLWLPGQPSFLKLFMGSMAG